MAIERGLRLRYGVRMLTPPSSPRLPAPGERVVAFHPTARAWRPATVLAVTAPDAVLVNFMFFAQSETISRFCANEHTVKWPEEVEPLESAGDFLQHHGDSVQDEAWRAMLFSLTLVDPRIYGERRAARNLQPSGVAPRDLYALLVAAMLDADARIAGGAALFVRLRAQCADFDPVAMAALGERDIEAVRMVMPSPLRARVLFANARTFAQLAAQAGGFMAWLEAQGDPVKSLCDTFARLEPRAAVLFLRYLGWGTIAPDDALARLALRLGWIAPGAPPTELRRVFEQLAARVGDLAGLVDLTARRFADAVCAEEPDCQRCAMPHCPARQAEPAVELPA
jgi:endonuclease III